MYSFAQNHLGLIATKEFDDQSQTSSVDILTKLCKNLSLTGTCNIPIEKPSSNCPTLENASIGTNSPYIKYYVFDWDNTLCPTDWLCKIYAQDNLNIFTTKKQSPSLENNFNKAKLEQFEQSVCKLLVKCHRKGVLAILSNATNFGISRTLKCLPLVDKTLISLGVKIISARDICEPKGLTIEQWKTTVLMQMVKSLRVENKNKNLSIMTIGDQELEHLALQSVAIELFTTSKVDCHPKYIKFLEFPSIEILNKQINSLFTLIDEFLDEDTGTYDMANPF